MLLSENRSNRAQLISEPFRNWKKATERFDEHFRTKRHNSGDSSTSRHKLPGTGYESHMNCYIKSQEFLKCCNNQQDNVSVALNKALQERKTKNMKILETIVDTVLLCGRQNFSLRGHRDDSKHDLDPSLNTGNFKALLKYRANGGDVLLADHIKNAPNNATYTSKTIQNELISIIGDHIQKQIVQECNASGGWFSLSADEVRDVSNKEQLAVTIRFVDSNDKIREEFMSFIDVSEDTTGENLSKELLRLLQYLNLDPNKMRSQCYDGAGNMAGK